MDKNHKPWNGTDCPGTKISTGSCNLQKCKGRLQKLKTSKVYSPLNLNFMPWIVCSNQQWMVVGANGRHGSHAAWLVEGETGLVLAHALIQRHNGTELIAQGQISPQRAAICTNVKVGLQKLETSNVFALFKSNQCHKLMFLLIISEWQLGSVVGMGTMQCDMWRRTADTCSHMF